ncbi:DUF1254 domain-containing protein [Roseibium sp. RKSG952]|uniref:DUF1254 domain-containing protein n=1 Tax=Roseibium sp. RKSG952 TaxID=2529384 RepID=UPI0012BC1110|nr:DUF1254 domain-containing protein [Roseibium sp. RKSG952]MTH95573.1 hypothetical protein [Roseibium sp. RKSG952]
MLPDRLKLVTGLLAAVAIAGIVHILVILTVPQNVSHSAYATLADFGPDLAFNLLPDVTPGSEPLPALDPAMKHAACRFQLDQGPVKFTASIPAPFWSIGLFNASGETVYSLNNRTAGSETLSMLVLTPQQLSILRENPPEDLEDLIVIETDTLEGFALLRAFVPDPSLNGLITDALSTANCGELV